MYEYPYSEDEYSHDSDSNAQEDSDNEVEVLGVGSDDESDMAQSDVEGQEDEDDLPDSRAWGKQKKKFYGTDYVDQDYGGVQGKDADAADLELVEAQELQKKMMQQLDFDFLELDGLKSSEDKQSKVEEEIVKFDLSKLTHKQKLEKLQKESPEFFVLTDDVKTKLTEAKQLSNIIETVKNIEDKNCKAMMFVKSYYQLVLNYGVNVYMYVLLKSTNKIKNHPVTQRLYQYRQILNQVEPVLEEVIKPQLELLLEKQTEVIELQKLEKKKTLTFSAKLQSGEKKRKQATVDEGQSSKKIKANNGTKTVSFDLEEDIEDNPEQVEELAEMGKRAITYQIAKNKGLTPYRKKELRNPRVKHKLKYRRALIRRKGAVREPRRELQRYGGEISGIKATVSKSRKIKS